MCYTVINMHARLDIQPWRVGESSGYPQAEKSENLQGSGFRCERLGIHDSQRLKDVRGLWVQRRWF